MKRVVEIYLDYFPFVAVILFILLWRLKKQILKSVPETSFIEAVKTKRSLLDQSLLRKYIIFGVSFGFLSSIYLVLKNFY